MEGRREEKKCLLLRTNSQIENFRGSIIFKYKRLVVKVGKEKKIVIAIRKKKVKEKETQDVTVDTINSGFLLLLPTLFSVQLVEDAFHPSLGHINPLRLSN